MFKLPVYFISDNHFTLNIDPNEKERRNRLYKVFEQIKSTGGTLVIGGDFFDFWFNYKNMLPSGYADLMEQLDRLNQAGISIHFVLGNHDYGEHYCKCDIDDKEHYQVQYGKLSQKRFKIE